MTTRLTISRRSSRWLSALFLTSLIIAGCSSSDNDDTAPGVNTEVPASDGTTDEGVPAQTDDGATANTDGTTTEGGTSDSADSAGIGDPVDGLTTLEVDAAAGGFGAAPDDPDNKWTYFNFSTNEVIDINDAEADDSLEWHIAFKRVGVRLNGGISGPGSVSGAIIDAQSEFYDENGEPDLTVFSGATADGQLSAVSDNVASGELSFITDREIPAVNGEGQDQDASWWIYNASEHSVNANPDVWYVIRGAEGDSFSKLHVTDIQQSDRQITVELFLQSLGTDLFATDSVIWTAAIGADGGSLCYDFDQTVEVDCRAQSDTWDIQLEVSSDGRGWSIWTNGEVRGSGTEGASFGPLSSESQMAFVSAASVPNYFSDTSGGIFADQNWYEYNLEGNHRIWPNYRVYAVKAGETTYKMQMLSYYDMAGTSGILTMRFGVAE